MSSSSESATRSDRAGPSSDAAFTEQDFVRFVELNAGPTLDDERGDALRSILSAVAAELAKEGGALASFPGIVREAMSPFGWLWNGFYLLTDSEDELVLGAAAGPPVCGVLERSGGLFSSGMCFDALFMNQTLVSRAGSSWPGYVSCDGASGLATVAGIVVPLRDPSGRPFGVWDLDATADVEPGDVRFMDVLLATLGRFRDLTQSGGAG